MPLSRREILCFFFPLFFLFGDSFSLLWFLFFYIASSFMFSTMIFGLIFFLLEGCWSKPALFLFALFSMILKVVAYLWMVITRSYMWSLLFSLSFTEIRVPCDTILLCYFTILSRSSLRVLSCRILSGFLWLSRELFRLWKLLVWFFESIEFNLRGFSVDTSTVRVFMICCAPISSSMFLDSLSFLSRNLEVYCLSYF